MKKVFICFLVVVLGMTACKKTNYVGPEEGTYGDEIAFRAYNSLQDTKTNDLAATLLPNTWGIYASATQRTVTGLMENPSYFSQATTPAYLVPGERLFGTNDGSVSATSKWQHGTYLGSPTPAFEVSPLYWPIGGSKIDFLAYAIPMSVHRTDDAYWDTVNNAKKTPTPTVAQPWVVQWDYVKTDAASYMSFNSVDTYANQTDVLYAAANDQTSAVNGRASGAATGNSVKMVFNHAQALLIFNVKIDDGASQLAINEIQFVTPERVKAQIDDEVLKATGVPSALAALDKDDVTLKTIGTFWVDNRRNVLEHGWTFQTDTKGNNNYCYSTANYKMPGFTELSPANNVGITAGINYDAAIATVGSFLQLGNSLLIPEQEKVNFTIKYTLNGKTLFYTFNDLRGMWQSGYKYIYNLDIDMNEIVLTEEVLPFTDASLADIPL